MVLRLQARTHRGVDAVAALHAIPAHGAIGVGCQRTGSSGRRHAPAPAAGIRAVGATCVRAMAAASTRQAFRGGPRDVCCMAGGGG
ncbi:hypothetical protein G6F62_015927 [Rhizopus arrhizus]|nr:hypothetical protein G6F62_015927 [Rhizopus arrhizus]